ncbi:signal recognition particle protein [Erysipelothrix rhusiopathiae]|uniref:Signal recognition particle protein n=1 Tax=Erysipelothrix rhusiopathiae ATCC 19414 TaxID=525280 RepID=E7FTR6_ERYRH|nr:signal recognition particle protein [Erysipelothrix rhusiopathiae]EFY09300.1 signal recognition particle protein [Erysipelothrix rhusiopathiae ATCC 19414]MDE8117942.1 signal recognition particle protein [Erysipelothrix rhusiopathiae]MDE8124985.1 signal recognition particle protein [Erysipelothrix rhusiopathiae]MDE8157343.1 signal recognition particle protein [Erysipelothrix rhusiopathiae]MDE8172955.1 signal recognition particle protein [Erysipelothrix rhusiopathiae]
MAFDNLTNRLQDTFRNMTGKGKLSEKNITDALSEIRISLLEADVSLDVINELLEHTRSEALGMKVTRDVEPSQMFVKIVNDKLIEILGEEKSELDFNQKPGILMMVGLQGSGKTTTIAKIANKLNKEGKKVLLVAADLARPAAIEQLKILGTQIGVEVFAQENSTPVEVVKNALAHGKDFDLILIDTAGRLQIDDALMQQLVDIQALTKPDEILLSVDAMSGQDVIHVANGFKEKLNITGLVATKFDGDSRGGSILSVRYMTQVPVKFVGVGEGIDELDEFYPDRTASRILGMGDIVSLVEKAQEKMDIEASERSAERMMKGQFTLDDMLIQLQQVSKMGPLSGLMKMMPGANQLAGQIDDADASSTMKKTEAMILSMTPEERNDPKIIRSTRKRRIAEGSGTSTTDVNRLLSQYEKMQKQMKMLSRFMGK